MDDIDDHLHSAGRLAAVRGTELLDSPPEEAFDALTRLACTLLGVPASFISIVDAARDFYLSQFGFPEALARARSLEGTTFCHYTLGRDEPLAIADTHADPQWRAVPTVATLGVRAYVGVPLRLGGETVGSFCAIDNRPRDWTPAEIETLGQLALSAARELALRAALREALAQAARAQAAVRAKESVLATVAHDLRSPLNVVALNAQWLEHSATTAQSAAVRRMLGAVESMARLTDELLTERTVLADGGRERLPIAAAQLLADVADTMQLVASRAGIALVLDVGRLPAEAGLRVDYPQLLRVFSNLIGNAIKYCPAGSTITVGGVGAAGEAWLTVDDDGPGMGAEDVARAFERGWQGAHGLARADGAGLGLAIVQALVAQNGGQVTLDSAPGRGTTVTVRLPCVPAVAR